jgi:hypothetical protein
MATKKENPDFTVLRGHVPKELFKRFKVFCIEESLDNSQGLERVLQGYFDTENITSANKKEECV